MGVGRAVAVVSGKGGVGKTTSVAGLASAVALMGYKTVVVDADTGLRNLDTVLGLSNLVEFDLGDVLTDKCSFDQAMIIDPRFQKKLFFLGSPQTKSNQCISPENMILFYTALKRYFDFIFVDSPAGIDVGFHSAVSGIDEALVVTTPDVLAVSDSLRVIKILEEKEIPAGIIINRITLRPDGTVADDGMSLSEIVENLGSETSYEVLIPEDALMPKLLFEGTPSALCNESISGYFWKKYAQKIHSASMSSRTKNKPDALMEDLILSSRKFIQGMVKKDRWCSIRKIFSFFLLPFFLFKKKVNSDKK